MSDNPSSGAIRPNPLPEWCGAGLRTPLVNEDGKVVSEVRRMCGLTEAHEWHQDRFNADIRWKSLPPFAERPERESPRRMRYCTCGQQVRGLHRYNGEPCTPSGNGPQEAPR